MRLARTASLALVAALAGCSNRSLDGSLSEAFDLSFSSIDVRRSPTAFQVSYLRSEGREVVARITVVSLWRTETGEFVGMPLKGETALGGLYDEGHQRTTVTRAMDQEPLLVLPLVTSGVMSLDDEPNPGAEITGDFSLRFGDGGDVGAGRTLYGEFEGKVLAAD